MNYQLTIDSFIGPWAYSKQYVRNILDNYKGKHVDVKISSYGGNLDHGLDIRQQFVDHGDVTVYLSGFVASAATVIAMGAKRIVMGKYAMFLVHKCSNFIDAWGSYNADQMQELIEQLQANKKENDKIDVVLANMYAAKCKKPVSDILSVLKEGRWLTAQEALDLGFVDEIRDDMPEGKINFSPELEQKFNALGLTTCGLVESPLTAENDDETVPRSLIERIVAATVKTSHKLFGNSQEKINNQTSKQSDMKTFKFNAVETLLDGGSISPDGEGNVTITAEQLETLNNRLESLENDLTERTNEVQALNTQVENLKKTPGDDTSDIKSDGADSSSFNANEVFNQLKSVL